MTHFELASVLGTRATEIEQGRPSTVDYGEESDPLKIAILEFEARRIPVTVVRTLRGQQYELSANELSRELLQAIRL